MMKKTFALWLLAATLSKALFAQERHEPVIESIKLETGDTPDRFPREKQKLAFENARFRIAQFTDLHWTPKSAKCAETTATIRAVLEAEKPHLAVLTGDIVTDTPAVEGWKAVIRIFEEARTPFVVTMGNHDPEVMKRDEIFDLLIQSPCYVGTKGPEHFRGRGNCAIAIEGMNGNTQVRTKALLYCIDSNDYRPTDKHGHYDWIHFDQIHWYLQTSRGFAAYNDRKPIPALAFFHIPLPEYKHVIARKAYFGEFREAGIGSPEVNSGILSAFIEQGDVMGVFTGHDHNNDFIGMEQGIALAYGRVSGSDAYGTLTRGARIIELHEGLMRFDTWISTPEGRGPVFHYPSALTSEDERDMPYLPAVKVNPKEPGVAYTYYEGPCKRTEQIASMTAVKTGTMPNFSIRAAASDDHFAYEFTAWLKIDQRGVYRFYTHSDDGTVLFIDGQKVVDNDGGHSARRAEGKVALEAGFHQLRLLYFEDYMGQTLEVGYSSRDIFSQPLPDRILYVKK